MAISNYKPELKKELITLFKIVTNKKSLYKHPQF